MSSNTNFIPGLELSEEFYVEAVEPIIRAHFPQLSYAAALIGSGSEVLGFDNEISTDHHWGPRVMLFLNEVDMPIFSESIKTVLSKQLPHRFRGYPTSYLASDAADDAAHAIQILDYNNEGPVNHRVSIETLDHFLNDYLGFRIQYEITPADWLSFPDQKLLSITKGKVFHDTIGLEDLRRQFAYYPHDVWLYLMASAWCRIEQEEHLMGRAGSMGDEIGAAIIASRLVRDLMRLCFLMEKQYAPYPKWFGTAFRQLESADVLEPILMQVLSANNWKEREKNLVAAYEYVAKRHNKLNLTELLPEEASLFHDRPYRVISMGVFSQSIISKITDPAVKVIASKPLIGSIDQLSDSTDLLSNTLWREALCSLYNSPTES